MPKIYSISYLIFFLACTTICYLIPTEIVPFEIAELKLDSYIMYSETDAFQTEFPRSVYHYCVVLLVLSFIWLPSVLLALRQTSSVFRIIHFSLLCLATGLILFMNGDFFGESMFLTDIYIGGETAFTPVEIQYTWYQEIVMTTFPFWLYEVINEQVLIGFLCLAVSHAMLFISLSKTSTKK